MMNITAFSEMLAIPFLLGIVVLLILFRLNIFYSSIQFQKTIINQVKPCEARQWIREARSRRVMEMDLPR